MVSKSRCLTGEQALEVLTTTCGFEIERITDKSYLRRGVLRIALPIGSSECDIGLDKVIQGIIWENEARNSKDKKPDALPTMVTYRSVVYAVVEEQGNKYQLLDLGTGVKFLVDKKQCKEYEVPPIVMMDEDEEKSSMVVVEKIESAVETTPVPETASMYQRSGNLVDMSMLIRMTTKRIEQLKIEQEQVNNRLELINADIEATVNFLRSLHVKEDAIRELGITKVKVVNVDVGLVKTNSNNGNGRRRLDDSKVEKIRSMLKENYQASAIAMTLDISPATVYYYRDKFNKE